MDIPNTNTRKTITGNDTDTKTWVDAGSQLRNLWSTTAVSYRPLVLVKNNEHVQGASEIWVSHWNWWFAIVGRIRWWWTWLVKRDALHNIAHSGQELMKRQYPWLQKLVFFKSIHCELSRLNWFPGDLLKAADTAIDFRYIYIYIWKHVFM